MDALLDLLADEDERAAVEQALSRVGLPAAGRALERLHTERELRAPIVRAIGRLAVETRDGALRDALVGLLRDEDARTRRAAATALGKLRDEGSEAPLLEAWAREEQGPERRAIAEALGKVGGARSLALFSSLSTDDRELRRIADEALLRLRRAAPEASAPAAIDPGLGPEQPTVVIARCRRGLERIFADELAPLHPAIDGPGAVRVTLAGPLGDLFRARTMLGFGFPLPSQRREEGEEIGAALGRALRSPEAEALLRRFTPGAARYRIEWAGEGRHRAEIVRAAQAMERALPSLVNDPSRRHWEVVVHADGAHVAVELVPRLDDPRFSWRVADVPAASHPTIAAALARVGGSRADDVVWDPFCGSGGELIERARLGPAKRLVGTDVDPRALDAARANLAAAGVQAHLLLGDARVMVPTGVTLILTNPPMGRRVVRSASLVLLLDEIVGIAARVLSRGGRMVWLSPQPARTADRARSLGLAVEEVARVDLGGFEAALQVLRR